MRDFSLSRLIAGEQLGLPSGSLVRQTSLCLRQREGYLFRGMLGWLLLGFVLGAVAGAGGAWYWFTLHPRPAPRGAAGPGVLEGPAATGGENLDDLSQTAKRLVTDLEKKYEGIGSATAETPAPKRRRTKRAPPPADS